MSSHLLSAETVYSEHPEPGTDNSLTGIREMATMFAEFNRVDSSRCFGFSSGLPASFGVSISELQAGNRHLTENLRRRIFIEFLKALITIVFPIKNLALALRTAARYGYCRTSRQASGSHSALISVGPEAKRDDKYFGRLASHLDQLLETTLVSYSKYNSLMKIINCS